MPLLHGDLGLFCVPGPMKIVLTSHYNKKRRTSRTTAERTTIEDDLEAVVKLVLLLRGPVLPLSRPPLGVREEEARGSGAPSFSKAGT